MSEVIVVGAGPAGSVAALVLARAGVDVTLVEQQRFPRDKVCGECLSALGIETLRSLGLAEELKGLGPAVLRRTEVCTVGGTRYGMELPGEMWGISRGVLDAFLLRQATLAGAKVVQPARCEGLERGGVRVRDLVSNDLRVMGCERVVVADGKCVQSQAPAPPTKDFGIKTHFKNVEAPRDVIELCAARGAYGGLAPIEDGRWNVAWSVPGDWLKKAGGDMGEVFERVCAENAELRRRMKGAVRVGDWLAAPLPRYGVRTKWAEGVLPVGNAAAAIEPIGGEGMGLAMASAALAGVLIAGEFLGQDPPTHGLRQLFRAYEKLWHVRAIGCRAAAVVVSRPRAARVLLPLLRAPGVNGVAMWMMGKCAQD